jgi:K+-sensing histidine kinase KdpD
MKPHLSLKRSVTAGLGVVVCAWTAALLSFFLHTGHEQRLIAPIMLLIVVALVALRCGVIAGVLGSAVGALILAVFLYQPLGSPTIANKDARTNLAWLILGGLAFSYLLGQRSGGSEHHH